VNQGYGSGSLARKMQFSHNLPLFSCAWNGDGTTIFGGDS